MWSRSEGYHNLCVYVGREPTTTWAERRSFLLEGSDVRSHTILVNRRERRIILVLWSAVRIVPRYHSRTKHAMNVLNSFLDTAPRVGNKFTIVVLMFCTSFDSFRSLRKDLMGA